MFLKLDLDINQCLSIIDQKVINALKDLLFSSFTETASSNLAYVLVTIRIDFYIINFD